MKALHTLPYLLPACAVAACVEASPPAKLPQTLSPIIVALVRPEPTAGSPFRGVLQIDERRCVSLRGAKSNYFLVWPVGTKVRNTERGWEVVTPRNAVLINATVMGNGTFVASEGGGQLARTSEWKTCARGEIIVVSGITEGN